ncbi:MAG: toprim domain-containing protein [Patescibacteria group bacterium]
MMRLPEAIKKLAEELTRLPSIGPRQATRLAFYLVSRGVNEIRGLADAVSDIKNIKICSRCFFVHQNLGELCDICSNPSRRRDVIMIVEKETDLISVENTGKFIGRYFIIGPIPKTGVFEDLQKLRIQNLKNGIKKELGGSAEEIIFGFNPTSLGDFHASLLSKEFQPLAKKISRLGRGLPTGGEIEFADDETLSGALEHRI